MPDENRAFDEEYVGGTATSSEVRGRKATPALTEPYPPVEEIRYGVGKPTRDVMRARIIHGQGKEGE